MLALPANTVDRVMPRSSQASCCRSDLFHTIAGEAVKKVAVVVFGRKVFDLFRCREVASQVVAV